MSYHYRTRGMAALGATTELYTVTVWDNKKKPGRYIKGRGSSAKEVPPSTPGGKWYDGGYIYSKVQEGKQAAEADLARVAQVYDNQGKQHGLGARYGHRMKLTGYKAAAVVAAPPPGPRPPRPGVTVESRGPAPPPSDTPPAPGPPISRRDAPPSGHPASDEYGPLVETENVAVTDKGPVPATATGKPASPDGRPLAPVQEAASSRPSTRTLLMIGGGLLAAYLLFGRKRS